MASTGAERREFTRAQVDAPVRLASEEGQRFAGTLKDIGMKGVLVDTDAPLEPREDCYLTINWEKAPEGISGRGHVVRNDDGGLAVAFTEIDSDCYENLYLLIAAHARDSAQVRQEVLEHKGLAQYESEWSRVAQAARRHQPF